MITRDLGVVEPSRRRATVRSSRADEERELVRGGVRGQRREEVRVVRGEEELVRGVGRDHLPEHRGVRRERKHVGLVEDERRVLGGQEDRGVEEQALHAVRERVEVVVRDLVGAHLRQPERRPGGVEAQLPPQLGDQLPKEVVDALAVAGDVPQVRAVRDRDERRAVRQVGAVLPRAGAGVHVVPEPVEHTGTLDRSRAPGEVERRARRPKLSVQGPLSSRHPRRQRQAPFPARQGRR